MPADDRERYGTFRIYVQRPETDLHVRVTEYGLHIDGVTAVAASTDPDGHLDSPDSTWLCLERGTWTVTQSDIPYPVPPYDCGYDGILQAAIKQWDDDDDGLSYWFEAHTPEQRARARELVQTIREAAAEIAALLALEDSEWEQFKATIEARATDDATTPEGE